MHACCGSGGWVVHATACSHSGESTHHPTMGSFSAWRAMSAGFGDHCGNLCLAQTAVARRGAGSLVAGTALKNKQAALFLCNGMN